MQLTQIDLLRLCPDARAALFDEMQELIVERLPRSPRTYLDRGYSGEHLHSSTAAVLRDEAGKLVGKQLISARDLDLEGERLTLVRSGVVKAAFVERTPRVFDAFGVRELLRVAVRSWARRRQPWLLATSTGPVSYLRMARYFRRMVPPPSPGREPSAADERVFRALCRELRIQLDEDHPYASSSMWPPEMTAAERESWEARPEPAIARLIAECPRFWIDQVLVFGVPITPAAVASMLWSAFRS
ncbi:MAG: hypothetical protein R3A79_15165 [Nannocystaceae bacterium]